MTYIVKDVTTKPVGEVWFRDVHPVEVNNINQWLRTLPGFIDQEVYVSTDTVIEKLYHFTDQQSYDAYVASAVSNPDEVMRTEYNAARGITSTQTPVT